MLAETRLIHICRSLCPQPLPASSCPPLPPLPLAVVLLSFNCDCMRLLFAVLSDQEQC